MKIKPKKEIEDLVKYVKNFFEKKGYKASEEIIYETLNLIERIRNPEFFHDDEYALISKFLMGEPGTGKTQYVKLYIELLKEIFGEDKVIEYRMDFDPDSGKEQLVEGINFREAVAQHSEKVDVEKPLFQALKEAEKGEKIVIFHAGEYDKADKKIDGVMLAPLDEGRLQTDQLGTVQIPKEKRNIIQFFLTANRNPDREYSNEFLRRVEFFEFEVLSPIYVREILMGIFKEENERTIVNIVILLYEALYKNFTEEKEEFVIKKMPSISECIKTIDDLKLLIKSGASGDLVKQKLLKGLVKFPNDRRKIETGSIAISHILRIFEEINPILQDNPNNQSAVEEIMKGYFGDDFMNLINRLRQLEEWNAEYNDAVRRGEITTIQHVLEPELMAITGTGKVQQATRGNRKNPDNAGLTSRLQTHLSIFDGTQKSDQWVILGGVDFNKVYHIQGWENYKKINGISPFSKFNHLQFMSFIGKCENAIMRNDGLLVYNKDGIKVGIRPVEIEEGLFGGNSYQILSNSYIIPAEAIEMIGKYMDFLSMQLEQFEMSNIYHIHQLRGDINYNELYEFLKDKTTEFFIRYPDCIYYSPIRLGLNCYVPAQNPVVESNYRGNDTDSIFLLRPTEWDDIYNVSIRATEIYPFCDRIRKIYKAIVKDMSIAKTEHFRILANTKNEELRVKREEDPNYNLDVREMPQTMWKDEPYAEFPDFGTGS